ncbi:MAG: hypothetical protein M3Q03_16960 [Chloroflexota bacterium]|nr:hypothetical protein [Chloroflexota bacterium]
MDERINDAGEAITYQRREWTAQRVGWTVMTLVVLAAVLGVLGNSGPVASARVTASDGSVQLTYTRLEHHHGPAELTVEVAPAFAGEGEVRLWLDSAYVQGLGLETIVPEPDRVEVALDRMVYVFTVAEPTGPLVIDFSHEHDGFWLQHGRLGIVDAQPVEFRQFVFP